jgi:hypothetical protein
MSVLGDSTAAAVFDNRDDADEAWSLLVEAGIPSTVITDPGILGAYRVEVVVDRNDLEAAQTALAPFINSRRPPT